MTRILHRGLGGWERCSAHQSLLQGRSIHRIWCVFDVALALPLDVVLPDAKCHGRNNHGDDDKDVDLIRGIHVLIAVLEKVHTEKALWWTLS